MTEVLEAWPTVRNTSKPPFFVDRRNALDYMVAGTFPGTGVTSYCAVPVEIPGWGRRHNQPMTKEEAVRVAEFLNDLQARGLIDWEPQFPVVRPGVS